MNEINRQLKLLKNEDIVWIIYFFIVIFALYTNHLERKDLLNNKKDNIKLSKTINTTILIIALFIYLYFLNISINSYKMAKNFNDQRISFEKIVVNLLFVVAGFLSIYVDYDDNSTNPDLAIL